MNHILGKLHYTGKNNVDLLLSKHIWYHRLFLTNVYSNVESQAHK